MLRQDLSASIKLYPQWHCWKPMRRRAIAKHSALHDGGHDMHFQPPAPDGNAYTLLYWLAANKEANEEGKVHLGFVHSLIEKPSWKQECANYTDWGVSKQTQGTKTTGRTPGRWSISQLHMLSGTIVISSSTKTVML